MPALFRPVVAERLSLSSDGCAEPVLGLLSERGWAIVTTPEANVHCTSPDGRVYVGGLPEDNATWRRGVIWTIQATPTEPAAWPQGPARPAASRPEATPHTLPPHQHHRRRPCPST